MSPEHSRRTSRLSISPIILIPFTIALVASCAGAPDSGGATPSETSELDPFEVARVQAFLDSQYRHEDVHHTFTTRFNQAIDCVDFYAQPAAKMLPPNTVVMPQHVPTLKGAPLITDLNDGSLDQNGQIRHCPDGTVPIVHDNAEDIVRAGGLDQHLRRLGSISNRAVPRTPPPPGTQSATGGHAQAPGTAAPPESAGYHYALGVDMNLPSTGTAGLAHLGVYDPYVLPGTKDHSLSQIWVTSLGGITPCTAPNCVQTLEAGWNVDLGLYNQNTSTHFFTYSTRDGYHATGCYNTATLCQRDDGTLATGSMLMLPMNPPPPLTPGQIIASSAIGSTPVDELYLAWVSSNDGNWYLETTGGVVGFIPQSLFNNGFGGGQPLTRYAAVFQAGGEVYDSAPGGVHTSTEMGSGRMPGVGGYGTLAYQRTVQYGIDLGDNSGDSQIIDAPISTFLDDPDFYGIATTTPAGGANWNTYFYFGGPGQLQTPTGLTGHAGNASASLSWTGVPGALGYVVWRSTTAGTGFNPVGSTVAPATAFTDTGLTNGTTYFYVVSANARDVVSAQSTQVSVTPSNGTLPAAPTGVSESVSTGKVTIKWSSVSGATGYVVQRATKTGGPYTRLATPTASPYVDTAVVHGTKYFYVVAATNAAGQGPNSREVSATP